MATLKKVRTKFYKKEKVWLLFETGSARAYNVKTATALFSDGHKEEYKNGFHLQLPSQDTSYFVDVCNHLRDDD